MQCGRHREKEPTDDRSITHSICARCECAFDNYRGGPIDEVKKDKQTIEELKEDIRNEISGNVKWEAPEENDWKDVELPEEDQKFYDELVTEVETEMNIGLKR